MYINMDKNIHNVDNFMNGKSLYNIDGKSTIINVTSNSLSEFIEQIQPNATNSSSTGDELVVDTIVTNTLKVIERLYVGNDLLQIYAEQPEVINGTTTNSIMVTTNNASLENPDHISIKFNVPYIFPTPDHVPNASNNETPDNYLEIHDSKLRVTGPFTIIKSQKIAISDPIITVNYIDRVDAATPSTSALQINNFDKGLAFEYVETNGGDINVGFMGYSPTLDRFVFYKSGTYDGTNSYRIYKNGIDTGIDGQLTDYNISRVSTTGVDIDKMYVNYIMSADHTNNNSINVSSANNLYTTVTNNIIEQSQTFTGTYSGEAGIQSATLTRLNTLYDEKPIIMGNGSEVTIDEYVNVTKYASIGATSRNSNTVVEIGGNFTALNNISSNMLISGDITGYGNKDVYSFYSKPTVHTQNNTIVPVVSNTTLVPTALNIGTNGTVTNSSTLYIEGATTNAQENYALYVKSGDVKLNDNTVYFYKSKIIIEQEMGNKFSALRITNNNQSTELYTISRQNVNGNHELYIDGISTRIQTFGDNIYSITGTITGTQHTTLSCSFNINFIVCNVGNVMTIKNYTLHVIHNDDAIFDFDVSVNGQYVKFTGGNNNSVLTNWSGAIFVSTVTA